MSSCFCIGPQNGQPLCPCKMRGVRIIDGRYVKVEDLGPANVRDWKTDFEKITEKWENRELGAEEQFVAVVDDETAARIDAAACGENCGCKHPKTPEEVSIDQQLANMKIIATPEGFLQTTVNFMDDYYNDKERKE